MTRLSFQVTTPADARFLKAVRAFLSAILAEFTDEDGDMLVLALDEACSNLLKHRTAEMECPVEVKVEVEGALVRFRVVDFCAAGDVSSIRPRPLKDIRPGGLGTHFIAEIMDRVEFEPDPLREGRMTLLLEKELAARSES
jgi:sigma-B regulation protein RsbU (phosphoserine phosphatase)